MVKIRDRYEDEMMERWEIGEGGGGDGRSDGDENNGEEI